MGKDKIRNFARSGAWWHFCDKRLDRFQRSGNHMGAQKDLPEAALAQQYRTRQRRNDDESHQHAPEVVDNIRTTNYTCVGCAVG